MSAPFSLWSDFLRAVSLLSRQTAWILAFAAAVEGLFFLFGVASIWRGNPYRLYYPGRLVSQIEANLPGERQAPATGWPDRHTKVERPQPLLNTRQCGSAWGGSFTFGDGVADDQAWPYLVSLALGCQIKNVGVDGFSFDQTLLMFQQMPPQHSVVILGMARPMLLTSSASSWTFTDLDGNLPRARVTKPRFTLDGSTLKLIPRPEPEVPAIMQAYLQDDYGRAWAPVSFPFTLSIVHAIRRKFATNYAGEVNPMGPDPDAVKRRNVVVATIAAMARTARENANQFVILMIPALDYFEDDGFEAMMNRVSDVCTANPSKQLAQASRSTALTNDSGHYNAVGNAILADVLVKAMSDCGIKP